MQPHSTHNVEVHFVKRAAETRPLARDGEVSGYAVPAAVAGETPPALQDGPHHCCPFLFQPTSQMNVLLHLLLVCRRGRVAPQCSRQEPRGEALRGVAALGGHGTGRQGLCRRQGHKDSSLQHVIWKQFVQGRTRGVCAEVPHQKLKPQSSEGL